MSSKIPVHRGSGNVFADLGFDDAEDMRLRADLVQQMGTSSRAESSPRLRRQICSASSSLTCRRCFAAA